MLISVLNIKLTCEWHKAIKLNYKNTRTHVIVVLTVYQALYMCSRSEERAWAGCRQGRTMHSVWVLRHANQVQYVEPQEATLFSRLYLRNRSTLDIGVLGYIGILVL